MNANWWSWWLVLALMVFGVAVVYAGPNDGIYDRTAMLAFGVVIGMMVKVKPRRSR